MTSANQVSTASLPACNTVVSGVVVAILRNKHNRKHAVLVGFGDHVGMLRAQDMDGDGRIDTIGLGDSITALVRRTFINRDDKHRIYLSEKAWMKLTELSTDLSGSHVTGRVVSITAYGAFVQASPAPSSRPGGSPLDAG